MQMIENFARQWWRYWSVRLTFFWSTLVAWLIADPANMANFVDLFPHALHHLVGPMLGFAIFATIGTARGVVQTKLR